MQNLFSCFVSFVPYFLCGDISHTKKIIPDEASADKYILSFLCCDLSKWNIFFSQKRLFIVKQIKSLVLFSLLLYLLLTYCDF